MKLTPFWRLLMCPYRIWASRERSAAFEEAAQLVEAPDRWGLRYTKQAARIRNLKGAL